MQIRKDVFSFGFQLSHKHQDSEKLDGQVTFSVEVRDEYFLPELPGRECEGTQRPLCLCSMRSLLLYGNFFTWLDVR